MVRYIEFNRSRSLKVKFNDTFFSPYMTSFLAIDSNVCVNCSTPKELSFQTVILQLGFAYATPHVCVNCATPKDLSFQNIILQLSFPKFPYATFCEFVVFFFLLVY